MYVSVRAKLRFVSFLFMNQIDFFVILQLFDSGDCFKSNWCHMAFSEAKTFLMRAGEEGFDYLHLWGMQWEGRLPRWQKTQRSSPEPARACAFSLPSSGWILQWFYINFTVIILWFYGENSNSQPVKMKPLTNQRFWFLLTMGDFIWVVFYSVQVTLEE